MSWVISLPKAAPGSQGSQGMLCWRSSGTNLKSAKMVQQWSNFTNFIHFLYLNPARFMAYQPVTPVTPGVHIHCEQWDPHAV